MEQLLRNPRQARLPEKLIRNVGFRNMKKQNNNVRLIFALAAVPLLALSSCRTHHPRWTDEEMHLMYYYAAQAHTCEATYKLFYRVDDSKADLSSLPVFVSAFKAMQAAERRNPRIRNTEEVRLDMIAEAERTFRGHLSVMRTLDALCESDPSPEIRKLTGVFTEEPNKTLDATSQ